MEKGLGLWYKREEKDKNCVKYSQTICVYKDRKEGSAMEDSDIFSLYWDRDQRAIEETEKKYGAYCRTIGYNILGSREDAEECLSDACLGAWDTIPPQRPRSLRAYLGSLTRNRALSRYREEHAEKRGGGQTALVLEELQECLSAGSTVEEAMDTEILSETIERFVTGLSPKKRIIFLQRYWYLRPIREIADQQGMGENAVRLQLHRMRRSLQQELEKEGIWV